ncbi:hypothetical protein JHK87_015957 [Glycine soja]|nr:hypothetical protein JHK87_015957 [Glycine soja]
MRLESYIESRGHVTLEQPKSNPALQNISFPSTTDIGSEDKESCSIDILNGDIPGWLRDVVKVILEQKCFTHKNLDDICEGIRLALSYLNNADQYPCGEVNVADILSIKGTKQQPQRDLSQSIDYDDFPTEDMQYVDKEEIKNFEDKVISSKSEKKALEGRLQSAINQLQESEKTINNFKLELQTLKELNRILEEQVQNHAFINVDLDTRLTKTNLKEANHKVFALKVELKNKNQYCEDALKFSSNLKDCHNHISSNLSKKWSDNDVNQRDKPLHTHRNMISGTNNSEIHSQLMINEMEEQYVQTEQRLTMVDIVLDVEEGTSN